MKSFILKFLGYLFVAICLVGPVLLALFLGGCTGVMGFGPSPSEYYPALTEEAERAEWTPYPTITTSPPQRLPSLNRDNVGLIISGSDKVLMTPKSGFWLHAIVYDETEEIGCYEGALVQFCVEGQVCINAFTDEWCEARVWMEPPSGGWSFNEDYLVSFDICIMNEPARGKCGYGFATIDWYYGYLVYDKPEHWDDPAYCQPTIPGDCFDPKYAVP
jgi:hypothetical protein